MPKKLEGMIAVITVGTLFDEKLRRSLVLLFANTVTYVSGFKCSMSSRLGVRRIVSDAATEPLSRNLV